MSSDLHLKMCISLKSQNSSYRLSVSVSADMEKFLSVIYRDRPIRKFDLSVVIGIGRYGKSHIDRTLDLLLNSGQQLSCLAVIPYIKLGRS